MNVPRLTAAILVLAAATSAARADTLETDKEDWSIGPSIGFGYAALATDDGTQDRIATQVGLRVILRSHWELALDLRLDVEPAAGPGTKAVREYGALLWFIANLDLLPLTPFIGLGAGGLLDGPAPRRLAGTVGGCLGVALWFEATWRVSLRGAMRWDFWPDAVTMPTEILATAEWFF